MRSQITVARPSAEQIELSPNYPQIGMYDFDAGVHLTLVFGGEPGDAAAALERLAQVAAELAQRIRGETS